MPYVMSDLGQTKMGPGEHSAEEVAAAGGEPPSGPATRPWPSAGSTLMTRPCYPSSTLAMLGAQSQQVPVGQPCPASYTEAPPAGTPTGGTPSTGPTLRPSPFGTTTSGTGNIIGGSTAGKPIGTAIGQRYTPTGGKPPSPAGAKPGVNIAAIGGAARPAQVQPSTPSEPQPSALGPEAPTGAEAGAPSFFSQYKWWILGGGAALVATSVAAYFLLRKKGATAGLADDDDPAKCRCGSGEERYPLYDARGIFVAYTCDKCVKQVKSRYRPDIFDDPSYWTDEPVEPEE